MRPLCAKELETTVSPRGCEHFPSLTVDQGFKFILDLSGYGPSSCFSGQEFSFEPEEAPTAFLHFHKLRDGEIPNAL